MPSQHADPGLPLTGERTVPGVPRENYWFRRHEAVYAWIAESAVGEDVVEAGCGEGYGAEMLRRRGCTVTALDYDESVLAHVARRYPLLTTAHANLVDLPLPDASHDLLVSLQVVEHLWDLPGFLAEAHRVLRPGGTIVISTPNRLTFSPGLGRGDKPTNPFHVEEFDAEQLHGLLAGAGFADARTFGLSHGRRLLAVEQEKGPWAQRQVEAVLADAWPQDLLADVASVTTADFTIGPIADAADAGGVLDLIATARKGGR